MNRCSLTEFILVVCCFFVWRAFLVYNAAQIRLIRRSFMKKILQCFSVLSLVVGLLSACTTAIAPSDAYRDETAHQIYQKGKTALQDKNFSEAIKRFEALDVQYPFGVETEQAQYYLIYAYYMKEDYVLSASAAERFIRLHPANPHVDYAYYLRAL